tara:strand:+ start:573 stop:1109 length:537 start_codon:yes stop_codon:yes gene_type:complete
MNTKKATIFFWVMLILIVLVILISSVIGYIVLKDGNSESEILEENIILDKELVILGDVGNWENKSVEFIEHSGRYTSHGVNFNTYGVSYEHGSENLIQSHANINVFKNIKDRDAFFEVTIFGSSTNTYEENIISDIKVYTRLVKGVKNTMWEKDNYVIYTRAPEQNNEIFEAYFKEYS